MRNLIDSFLGLCYYIFMKKLKTIDIFMKKRKKMIDHRRTGKLAVGTK